jgi:serine/threonine protein phosphatase PrpC
MEDYIITQSDFMEKDQFLIGVFDGHGGREAARHVGNVICDVLLDDPSQSLEMKLKHAFPRIHESIRRSCLYVGTTACVAIINESRIVVANVGDTRCVFISGNVAERLTIDHHPDIVTEAAFIKSHGGFVKNGRVNDVLGCSRAIGDGAMGDVVRAVPHILTKSFDRRAGIRVIMACDGLWDVVGDQQAADLIRGCVDATGAARKLRDVAFQKGSTDNISVVVVDVSR